MCMCMCIDICATSTSIYICLCTCICRLPKPLAFDVADPLHMQFIIGAANLRAFMLGITPPPDCRDPAALTAALDTPTTLSGGALSPAPVISAST